MVNIVIFLVVMVIMIQYKLLIFLGIIDRCQYQFLELN